MLKKLCVFSILFSSFTIFAMQQINPELSEIISKFSNNRRELSLVIADFKINQDKNIFTLDLRALSERLDQKTFIALLTSIGTEQALEFLRAQSKSDTQFAKAILDTFIYYAYCLINAYQFEEFKPGSRSLEINIIKQNLQFLAKTGTDINAFAITPTTNILMVAALRNCLNTTVFLNRTRCQSIGYQL